MRRLALALTMILAAGACGVRDGTPAAELAPVTALDLPGGTFRAIDWTADEWIVVGFIPEGEPVSSGNRIWRLRPDGAEFQLLEVPEIDECAVADFLTPTALDDDRVAYWHLCRTLGNVRPPSLEVSTLDGDAEVLAPLKYNPNRIIWDVAAESGLISAGSGICDGIIRVTPDGIAPLALEVGEGDQRFRVDEYFYEPRACDKQGRATLPDRTPDGRRVAFFASPESTNGGFGNRLDLPWNIYLVDEPMESSTAVPVLAGIRHPRGLRWSPDGLTLAFSGEIDGASGSWLFDPSEETVRRFSDVSLAWLAWSPDGSRLVGVEFESSNPLKSHLLMFDMP